ncbi:MAG: hypothetical protein ABJF50_08310 [Paracoccaceae bacterium]
MNWTELQRNWTGLVDLIVLYFPHTDRSELLKMDGDLTSFARYLADAHELTFKEAVEAVDFVLLLDRQLPERDAQAA